ncbi:hypothetical protein D3C79_1095850 [compost metagenome]
MVLIGRVQQPLHAFLEFGVGSGFVDLGVGKTNVLDLPVVRSQIMLEALGE